MVVELTALVATEDVVAEVTPAGTVRPAGTVAAAVLLLVSDTTAPPDGAGAVSVTVAVKRARGGWTRLAADDSPPFRAFLDPLRYRRNELVHLVAVARGLDGSTAVSPVVPFRVRR